MTPKLTCKKSDLALMLDLSERRVSQPIQENIIPKGNPGFDVIRAVKAYVLFLRKEKNTLTEERRLLIRAKRLHAELECASGKANSSTKTGSWRATHPTKN